MHDAAENCTALNDAADRVALLSANATDRIRNLNCVETIHECIGIDSGSHAVGFSIDFVCCRQAAIRNIGESRRQRIKPTFS